MAAPGADRAGRMMRAPCCREGRAHLDREGRAARLGLSRAGDDGTIRVVNIAAAAYVTLRGHTDSAPRPRPPAYQRRGPQRSAASCTVYSVKYIVYAAGRSGAQHRHHVRVRM